MALFPELIPSTRTYSPGGFPHSVHGAHGGSEARVRHSNTVLGVRLRLFFPAITSAELLTVISHYSDQRGRFLPFAIPEELLSGVDTLADFTPAGHQWRYAGRPTVEDISVDGGTNLHNLTVELETVPPENTIVQGARLRVLSSLRAGSAKLGEFFDASTSLAAGSAAVQVDLLATVIFESGSPFPVVAFDVVATLNSGVAVPPDGPLLVFASLAAGGASGGPAFDPLDLSPVAWWDPSATGTVTVDAGNVEEITDNSGNGWDLSQVSPGNRPAYTSSGINGLHAIDWGAGSNAKYLQTGAGSFTIAEFYAVIDYSATAFGNFPGLLNPADNAPDGWFTGQNGGPGLFWGQPVFINTDNSTDYQADLFPEIESPCVLRWTKSSGTFSTSAGVVLGMDRLNFALNRGWQGFVGEVLVFDAPLASGDRADLVDYLMDKWGI